MTKKALPIRPINVLDEVLLLGPGHFNAWSDIGVLDALREAASLPVDAWEKLHDCIPARSLEWKERYAHVLAYAPAPNVVPILIELLNSESPSLTGRAAESLIERSDADLLPYVHQLTTEALSIIFDRTSGFDRTSMELLRRRIEALATGGVLE